MSWDNLKPPAAPVDGWGVATRNDVRKALDIATGVWPVAPKSEHVEGPDSWPVNPEDAGAHPDQTSPMTVGPEAFYDGSETFDSAQGHIAQHQLTEALWTATVLDSSNTRASVVNSLAGTKDAFNIDQDGELTRMKEIATGEKPMGYYIAYSNGKWLHAILSGPYSNAFALDAWGDEAYELMINDAAFKLAFGNEFDRSGIYTVQIPLAAKRHGAYGVLT